MKFTEAKLEMAFTELLGNKLYYNGRNKTIACHHPKVEG